MDIKNRIREKLNESNDLWIWTWAEKDKQWYNVKRVTPSNKDQELKLWKSEYPKAIYKISKIRPPDPGK